VNFRVNVQFTGRREPISMSGLARPLGVILRRRPCFFAADLPETPDASAADISFDPRRLVICLARHLFGGMQFQQTEENSS